MDSKLRICTICARGGSKGVPNKNLRTLLNKPLIAHTIEHANQSKLFLGVGVSSDSEQILDVSMKFGADWLIQRPPDLAHDQSPKLPVIQHCAHKIEKIIGQKFETIVDMDASAPIRRIKDIIEVVKLLENRDTSNVITGVKARRSPYFNLVELTEHETVRLSKTSAKLVTRRQDSPVCYDMNASIYAWHRSTLFKSNYVFLDKTRIHVMPEETAFDIDSENDFELVEWIMKKNTIK